jgi:hypothetical protein
MKVEFRRFYLFTLTQGENRGITGILNVIKVRLVFVVIIIIIIIIIILTWKLKEEALDRTHWRTRFGRGYGPVVRQTTE